MCNNNDNSPTTLVPYGLTCKSLSDSSAAAAAASATAAAYVSLGPGVTQAALEHYRFQLYNYAYADRFRYTHPALTAAAAAVAASTPFPMPSSAAGVAATYGAHMAHDVGPFGLGHYGSKYDPRAYRIQEEPKPQHSYIGLIGMAILSAPDKKLVLSDIYQYILDNYPYFRTRGPGWRNSIRHNLSLNDCFIKAGRSANGKGHYWAIHPANIEDFKKGDFRRRKAQRRVRKHMGLAVPEDDDSSSPPPPQTSSQSGRSSVWAEVNKKNSISETSSSGMGSSSSSSNTGAPNAPTTIRKRQFDVESLLAPDPDPEDRNHYVGIHVSGKRTEMLISNGSCKRKGPSEIGEEATSLTTSEQVPVSGESTTTITSTVDGGNNSSESHKRIVAAMDGGAVDEDSDDDDASHTEQRSVTPSRAGPSPPQVSSGPCGRTLWSLAQYSGSMARGNVTWPTSKPFMYALTASGNCWAALEVTHAAAVTAAVAADSDRDTRGSVEELPAPHPAGTTWTSC